MKFRTEVHFSEISEKINLDNQIFSIGSCFSSEICKILTNGQLQTYDNPFGTIFNPFSITNSVEKIVQKYQYGLDDLYCHQGKYISLDHHTDFDLMDAQSVLEKINHKIEEAHAFLKETKWILVTLGSSFVYELISSGNIVANCHKIPNQLFCKRLLSLDEIKNSLQKLITSFKKIAHQDVRILMTISPVRHIRDGIQENQLSKSRLIHSVHEVISAEKNCFYLPVYEMMMDDLRDYRFYKEDMIHPTEQAVHYIFEKFQRAFLSEETQRFIQECFKIQAFLNHRPTNPNHPDYLLVKEKIKKRIAQQQSCVQHPLNFKI